MTRVPEARAAAEEAAAAAADAAELEAQLTGAGCPPRATQVRRTLGC